MSESEVENSEEGQAPYRTVELIMMVVVVVKNACMYATHPLFHYA
jgi:hypothetical protein